MSSNKNTIHICRAAEVGTGDLITEQTNGMTRKAAIIKQSDKLSAYVMTSDPHTTSSIHTHGSLDTIIYAATSGATLVFQDGQESVTLSEGDFALIPAHCEHQEVNETDHEVKLIIMRSGPDAMVENLEGWGGSKK